MNQSFKHILEMALQSHLDFHSKDFQFAASVKLHENEVLNEKSHKDMSNIPVSLEELKKLANVISKGKNVVGLTKKFSRKMWQISGEEALKESGLATQVEKFSSTMPMLTNKMLRLMGVNPLPVEVKTTLQHVIICGTGSSIKFVCNENKGGFMKMILQIPVEGGHEGGQIKVELNDQIRLFSVCDGSDRYYHLTSFYSDCDHTLEEVTFGWRLTMVFDLELESTPFPCPLSPPADLYTFLAVKNLQFFMARWSPVRKDHPDTLVLLLEHRYPPSDLSFCRLKGRDRLLVELLLSIDTVNMYLTHLRKSERESTVETLSEEEDSEITDEEDSDCTVATCLCCIEKGCKCLSKEKRERDNFEFGTLIQLEYSSLTCLDNRTIEGPRINVDIDEEMICFNRDLYTLDTDETLVESDFLDTEGDHFDPSILRYVFNTRAVLVISPKHSLTLELICNFSLALDRLEANPDIRALNKVITFCQINPRIVWVGVKDREERTRRLVSMCVQLKAKSEGLELLKLLSNNFPGLPIQYEGLRNKAIAIEVASLFKLIGVNPTSCDCMYKLFSEQRTSEQIENYAHLVMGLYDLDLTDDMAKVRNNLGHICQRYLYTNESNFLLRNLPVSAIVTCTAMVFRMYEENSVMFMLHSLSIGLRSLSQRPLFFVIKGIATTCRAHLENSRECQQLQQELHRKLLSYFISKDLAVPVMFFYLKQDDAILLKKLTQELVYHGNMEAIEMIVASPDIWNMALTSLGGKWALNSLVSARISYLEKMHMPVFSWIQGNALFDHEPLLNKFFSSSAVRQTFTGFTSRQQVEAWCEELFETDQIDHGYSAKIEIRGEGSNFECVITKNRDLYRHYLKMYHQSRVELLALRERRLRRLPIEECSSKIRVINRASLNYSTSSGTSSSVSSPASKRLRSDEVKRK